MQGRGVVGEANSGAGSQLSIVTEALSVVFPVLTYLGTTHCGMSHLPFVRL